MEHFVARQPILGRKQLVYAYELLFRSGLNNFFDSTDGDEASTRVIANSFLLFGIENLTGGGRAFINFTREILVQGFAEVLPARWVVVEILENVEPDEQVINACRRLKDKGFLLALDDFVYEPKFKPLVEMADIIKVDFLISQGEERAQLAELCHKHGIKPLAEKVETIEDFQEALDLGYEYFQGYFFSKPVVVARKDVPGFKLHYLRILSAVNKPEMDFNEVTSLIESSVSISYKILKLINSAAFGLKQKVSSIQQALTLLGHDEIRKWSSLLTLSGMAEDKPPEMVVISLVRAKFCELMAPLLRKVDQRHDLFLMGLFSMIDAVVGRPMKEVLEEIPLADDVKNALLLNKGPLRRVLDLAVAHEKADWAEVSALAANLRVTESELPELHIQALQWPKEILMAS